MASIVVVVLLSLQEGFDIDRWDDPRLVPQRAQPPTDKGRAQAGFHANNTGRQLLKRLFQIQPPDLLAKSNLPVGPEPDEMKNLLANVDADHRQWRRRCLRTGLHRCSSCSLARQPG